MLIARSVRASQPRFLNFVSDVCVVGRSRLPIGSRSRDAVASRISGILSAPRLRAVGVINRTRAAWFTAFARRWRDSTQERPQRFETPCCPPLPDRPRSERRHVAHIASRSTRDPKPVERSCKAIPCCRPNKRGGPSEDATQRFRRFSSTTWSTRDRARRACRSSAPRRAARNLGVVAALSEFSGSVLERELAGLRPRVASLECFGSERDGEGPSPDARTGRLTERFATPHFAGSFARQRRWFVVAVAARGSR